MTKNDSELDKHIEQIRKSFMEFDHKKEMNSIPALENDPLKLQEENQENSLEPDQFVELDHRIVGVASLFRYKIASSPRA